MSQNLDVSNETPQPLSTATAIGVTYVPSSENSTLRRVMQETESQVILCALQHTGWNRKRAAAILKISYRGLLYKVRRYNITPNCGIQAAVPAQGSKIE
jgi:DNA-binding NtrC family response regulator